MIDSSSSWLKQLTRKKSNLSHGHNPESVHSPLRKVLGVWDLTAMGIAAVLGAGVFSTIGNAAFDGGPAVVFLFIFTAFACGFSALCYAEFASAIPTAGSAYNYAYASFGEITAWIIGWDLIMEYAIGNIAMAISWSRYFTGLLASYGLIVPSYLSTNFLDASRNYSRVTFLLSQGKKLQTIPWNELPAGALQNYQAWVEAPRIFNLPIICDLPALLIVGVITWIAYRGIEESKRLANFLVIFKVFIVLLVIGVGATYVQPLNWIPFAPNGLQGVLKGISAVFFAYIGFDALSTTAEECKNPQQDLPRGMIYSLVICTSLYAATTLVLTGMVNYRQLGVGDPLASVFGPSGVNLPWMAGIVNCSALIALATVLLVFQVGQPRIWMSMSRDGLLPARFRRIHPKYRTPSFATCITGAVVAIPSLFMNLTEVTDLTSIGTLFAFILVCGGTLRIPRSQGGVNRFKTPYFNSKYIFPALVLTVILGLVRLRPDELKQFLSLTEFSWIHLQPKIPLLVFSVCMIPLSWMCYRYEFSLIPVLGVSTCGYLMTELGITNWIRFGIWLLLGLVIYFLYGIKHSRLKPQR